MENSEKLTKLSNEHSNTKKLHAMKYLTSTPTEMKETMH